MTTRIGRRVGAFLLASLAGGFGLALVAAPARADDPTDPGTTVVTTAPDTTPDTTPPDTTADTTPETTAPDTTPDTTTPDTTTPDTTPDTTTPDTTTPDTADAQTPDSTPDTTPPDTTPPDTTPDTTPPDTTPPDTTPPDTTPPDTTPPDTTPPDTTPPDTTPPDTTPPDTTPPDTSPPDTTPPDTSPPDTTPSDPGPVEVIVTEPPSDASAALDLPEAPPAEAVVVDGDAASGNAAPAEKVAAGAQPEEVSLLVTDGALPVSSVDAPPDAKRVWAVQALHIRGASTKNALSSSGVQAQITGQLDAPPDGVWAAMGWAATRLGPWILLLFLALLVKQLAAGALRDQLHRQEISSG